MKEIKLTSMVDYVLSIEKNIPKGLLPLSEPCLKLFNYAKLLNQTLILGMFIPCDEDGNVLDVVIQMDYIPFEGHPTKYPQELYEHDLKQYQEAKERVLFKKLSFIENMSNNFVKLKKENNDEFLVCLSHKVESLVRQKLTLTESAIKKYGL